MTKDEFIGLSDVDKISYVNSELENGKTVKDITINLGLCKNYISNFMSKQNYKLDKKINQYMPTTELINTTVVEANTEPINTTVVETNTNTLLTKEKANTLDYISDNINILMDMIEKYKASTKSTTQTTTNYITIDLVDDKHLKPKPKSIRINEFIYQEWQEFCDKQHYSKMDLISMALKEYMQKYK